MKKPETEQEIYCSLCTASIDAISFADENAGLKRWIGALEQAWLQRKRGELVDGGMNVFAANIHANTQMNEAKHKYISGAD